MNQPIEKKTWYAETIEDTLLELGTTHDGLSQSDAESRLATYGPNTLAESARTSPLLRFLEQFKSPLIYILLIASAISFFLGETIDGTVILVIVFFNAVIGFVQEYKAERALEALKQLAAPTAFVRRNGREFEIPSNQVVPGDIVLIEAGDKIPADGRLIEATRLKIEEAALTGESVPVEKNTQALDKDTSLPDQDNMIFSSTTVVAGRGLAVITATGNNTVTGQIATDVGSAPVSETPIQRKLSDVGRLLGIVGVLIALLLVGIGILRGFELEELFFTAVAAAVSFIPEGLPAIVTIVLAVGVQRMARRNAIIRKLPAVEALGAATVICTDKTGTLTRNEMTVEECCTTEGVFRITGSGYSPRGEILADGKQVDPEDYHNLQLLLTVASLCNNAHLVQEDNRWSITGDPTEGALLVAAKKADIDRTDLEKLYPRIDEIPFDAEIKYMATLNRRDGQKSLLCVKGAPEKIISMCDHIRDRGSNTALSDERKREIEDSNKSMAEKAYRVLAVAYKEVNPNRTEILSEDVEGMIFLGLLGMIDPPRAEAIDSVARAKHAGIKIKMITGDNPITAQAIAKQLGMLDGDTVTGRELTRMSDEELSRRVEGISVFARVEPQDKYRIVEALKKNGELVAMTGDGVNDAPALKRADIGISMGITGTDVARESSDMVLTDDNFATIVAAIEEGRTIFSNLRKVVQYLLATNTGEILTFIAAIVIGFPLPLLPVQILFVNLVTDGFATAPLSLEPKSGDALNQPPRNPDEGVITKPMLYRIVMVAVIMAIGTLALFMYEYNLTDDLIRSRTVAFATLAIFQLFNAFNARSSTRSIFKVGFFTNPYVLLGVGVSFLMQIAVTYTPVLQRIFETTALSAGDWLRIIAVSSTVLIADEIRKALAPRLFHHGDV